MGKTRNSFGYIMSKAQFYCSGEEYGFEGYIWERAWRVGRIEGIHTRANEHAVWFRGNPRYYTAYAKDHQFVYFKCPDSKMDPLMRIPVEDYSRLAAKCEACWEGDNIPVKIPHWEDVPTEADIVAQMFPEPAPVITPTVRLDVFLVGHGYEAHIIMNGQEPGWIECRDFGDTYDEQELARELVVRMADMIKEFRKEK